jgi:hypothetical protein
VARGDWNCRLKRQKCASAYHGRQLKAQEKSRREFEAVLMSFTYVYRAPSGVRCSTGRSSRKIRRAPDDLLGFYVSTRGRPATTAPLEPPPPTAVGCCQPHSPLPSGPSAAKNRPSASGFAQFLYFRLASRKSLRGHPRMPEPGGAADGGASGVSRPRKRPGGGKAAG